MQELMKRLNYPITFLAIYLLKLLIVKASIADAMVLLVFMLGFIMIEVKNIFTKYYKTKEDIISENQFRSKVMDDIVSINNELNTIKLVSGGGFANGLMQRKK